MEHQELQLTLGYPSPVSERMSKVYMYVVDRDFGFAPNPFHGYCTLATCKPGIRNNAGVQDWVIGVGGARLKATGRCIFAMEITQKITYNEYWADSRYLDKKPVRNGSSRMMVGDNIYCFDFDMRQWKQADSHHSNSDGTVNLTNLQRDTKSDKVLISTHFFYFGKAAPCLPNKIMTEIGFKNRIGHCVFEREKCCDLIDWLHSEHGMAVNSVQADPFDFEISEHRYTGKGSKVI